MSHKLLPPFEPDVFERIIRGELPGHSIWEDAAHLAILDIRPIRRGHTLVIPKLRVDYLFDMEPEAYLALLEASRQVALRLKAFTGARRIAMAVAGYDVPHVHVHLIPTNSKADFPQAGERVEPGDLAGLAREIREFGI